METIFIMHLANSAVIVNFANVVEIALREDDTVHAVYNNGQGFYYSNSRDTAGISLFDKLDKFLFQARVASKRQ